MTRDPRRAAGGCYYVTISSLSRPVLTWTLNGADHEYPLPSRRQTITVCALDETDAHDRGLTIGAGIMGGRTVRVDKVELRCAARTHDREHHEMLPRPRTRTAPVDVTWRWLTDVK